MPILHADADAFFASVEARDRPDLADRPFVVGVDPGVVACPNYPARAYGIHGGMTIEQARRRCPQLQTVPPRFELYRRTGERLFELFARYAAVIEPGSMEEAFLDVADADPVQTAGRLRREVRDELGLGVSIGVGRTKLIAKLASRQAKPDGMVVIDGEAEQRLRDRLRIADVWGVGPTTRDRLCGIGVHTVRDLDAVPFDLLTSTVGLAMARRLERIALGTDDAAVRVPAPGRLISGERSVLPRSRSHRRVREVLAAATASVLERLAERGQLASRAEVTVTYDDGQTTTTRRGLGVPTDSADRIEQVAKELLDATGFVEDGRDVRRVRLTLTLQRVRMADAGQPLLPFA